MKRYKIRGMRVTMDYKNVTEDKTGDEVGLVIVEAEVSGKKKPIRRNLAGTLAEGLTELVRGLLEVRGYELYDRGDDVLCTSARERHTLLFFTAKRMPPNEYGELQGAFKQAAQSVIRGVAGQHADVRMQEAESVFEEGAKLRVQGRGPDAFNL